MATERTQRSRTTRQRARVLEAVRASGTTHPTAEQVFARVRGHLPRISLGTVYRNLQRLADEGRIGVARLDGRVARYDPVSEGHDHLVCDDCGQIVDLPPSPGGDGLRAARRAGHAVHAHALVLYGRCRACRRKETP